MILLVAAFAIYALFIQRVRITRRFTLTGSNAIKFGFTLLVLVLPLYLTLPGLLDATLPPAVLANPFAGRLVTLGALGAFVVLLAHAFRDRVGALLKCGQRVRVAATHPWAKLATGVIDPPPQAARVPSDADSSDYSRCIASRYGQVRFWWVQFDVPQIAMDGTGPHEGGPIAEHSIELIEKSDA